MKVAEIEGVGPAYAAKLEDAGIGSVEALLEAGGGASNRKNLADKTGIAEGLILRWVNHADLMRIDGVGPQFAELLEAGGVDSVAELAQRNAANLTVRLGEANKTLNLANRTPSESEVQKWIEQAGSLPKAVFH